MSIHRHNGIGIITRGSTPFPKVLPSLVSGVLSLSNYGILALDSGRGETTSPRLQWVVMTRPVRVKYVLFTEEGVL